MAAAGVTGGCSWGIRTGSAFVADTALRNVASSILGMSPREARPGHAELSLMLRWQNLPHATSIEHPSMRTPLRRVTDMS